MRLVPIILYHMLTDNPDLETHLIYLKNQGYESAHLADIKGYLTHPETVEFPDNAVVLTFDDAQQDFFHNVRPLLSQYDFTATVCVPTDYVSEHESNRKLSKWDSGPEESMMTWEELQIIADEGFEIVSHSASHRALHDLENDAVQLRYELQNSKRDIEAKLDVSFVEFFSLPYGGGWGKSVIKDELEKAGYAGALMAWYEPKEKRTFPEFFIPRWQIRAEQTIEEVLNEISSIDE